MLDKPTTTRTELGRIQKISFGWGGYQDAMIGVSITIGGQLWGCGNFKGAWGTDRSEYTRWSEEDRLRQLGQACMWVRELLTKAKVQTLDQLQGVPIEATFDGNLLESWRILDEVL
jgi:hypothetical protein